MLSVVFYPLLYNFLLAFRNMSLYHFQVTEFVGLRHFRAIFADPSFYSVFAKTLVWTVVNVFFHVTLGVMLGILINRPLPGRAVMRALLILPWAVPQYISALTWKGMFNYEYGAINLMLTRLLHLAPVPWLSDAFWAFVAPILTNVWLGFPFMMIVTLGGLQSIPQEMYEAADIDGATAFQKLTRITLPMLAPILAPAIVLGVVWTFNNLNIVWLVTEGGRPADQSHILNTYIYKSAFAYNRYSYAAAFSVIVFLILLGFLLLTARTQKRQAGA
ncbi:MAG: sugar ABC transporter permease [Candidatus Eisenbacteria bacterium]|nr:sugar ABC transporter permease [Candidatus Eisenbacteria bacterium]